MSVVEEGGGRAGQESRVDRCCADDEEDAEFDEALEEAEWVLELEAGRK